MKEVLRLYSSMATHWARAMAAASAGVTAGLVQNMTNRGIQQEPPIKAGAMGQHTRHSEKSNTEKNMQRNSISAYEAQDTSDSTAAYFLQTAARCASAKEPRNANSQVRHDCGEDAFFVAGASRSAAVLGIADGVGQWSSFGVDPAAFSWELMNNCQAVAEKGETKPLYILAHGFDQLATQGKVQAGSSTACVASFDYSSGRLKVANLGDSGAIILNREGKCVLETAPQQHGFNEPYQFMVAPEGFGDMTYDADQYSVVAQEGDILILATDGLFDNLWPDEVKSVVKALHDEEPGSIAEALVIAARKRSHGCQPSPFSHACLENQIPHEGGKTDDITVVASRIVSSQTCS